MKKLLLKLGLASQEAEAVMAADEHDHSLQALHVIEKVHLNTLYIFITWPGVVIS
jgi:hypothetical protein